MFLLECCILLLKCVIFIENCYFSGEEFYKYIFGEIQFSKVNSTFKINSEIVSVHNFVENSEA